MSLKFESLLENIRAAHRTYIPEPKSSDWSIEKHFEEIEKWIAGEEPEHTLGYWCGLKSEKFFPIEEFTEDEMKELLQAFNEMLFTWNISIDFPECIPTKFAFQLTVNKLEEKTDIINEGMIHFDFCSGYAPDCEFREYCPCLEVWNSEGDVDMDNFEAGDGELPF